MIIADENIPRFIISALRNNKWNVLSIKESHKGISDEEIIQLSKATTG